jgi:hypothetical protein
MLKETLLACTLALAALGPAASQSADGRSDWPGAGQLFVGTNYQPFDRAREQIPRDIARMKQAGMKVVRMGDLAWDSFEPAEGKFDFKTFDWIMDQMQAAGLKVILDIPGQPAPVWLHKKYPGVDIVTQQGTRLDPVERYMDNTSDPNYRRLLVRLADTMTKRYAKHPALFAIGYNNESGNGMVSYSEADRLRFIGWLKKYGTVEALNKAWATWPGSALTGGAITPASPALLWSRSRRCWRWMWTRPPRPSRSAAKRCASRWTSARARSPSIAPMARCSCANARQPASMKCRSPGSPPTRSARPSRCRPTSRSTAWASTWGVDGCGWTAPRSKSAASATTRRGGGRHQAPGPRIRSTRARSEWAAARCTSAARSTRRRWALSA